MIKTQPFPMVSLPVVVRNYVQEASNAIGCHPSYVALPLFAALARAIGNKYTIRLKPTWQEPAVIWGAVIAYSSGQKSPAQDIALRFLEQFQNAAGAPEYITDDMTYAALRQTLDNQPDKDTSILYAPDELIEVFGSFGRGGQSSLKRGHWLKCWQAKSFRVHRYNQRVCISTANVSIVGGIQPGVFKNVMTKESQLTDGGMCARFLLTYQPDWKGSILTNRAVSAATHKAMRQCFRAILDRGGNATSGYVIPSPIDLTANAAKMFREFQKRTIRQANKLDHDLFAAYRKLEAYAARFALIFQLVASAPKKTNPQKPLVISAPSMQCGINLAEWFKSEARKVYAMLGESKVSGQRTELIRLIKANGGTITVRELMRKSPLKYGEEPKATKALNDLAQEGLATWRTDKPGKLGGRPTRRLYLK